MDRDIDDLFDDDDEEIVDFINNERVYNVRNRCNHYEEWNEREFFNRFRLSKNTVEELLQEIQHLLIYDTPQYHTLMPMAQLLLTLRFYATGDMYVALGDFAGIHKTTAGRILTRVTQAIAGLRATYIFLPRNQNEMDETQNGFYNVSLFPRVIGAVDGTHIRMQSPGGDNAEFFRNRKGYFSLNVQGICSSKNKILDIVARWPGASHDSYIFDNSAVRQRFENGEFGDAVLLGDSGYPLRNYLMTPLANPRNDAETMYNNCHIRTRTIIERTFGIWKRRFPVLSIGMRCRLPLMQSIIVATAVLHNIAVDNREEIPELCDQDNGDNADAVLQQIPLVINDVQQRYIHYFATLL